MNADSNGIVEIASRYPVAETIDRLDASARARGLLVFARIDFSGDAARAGLALRPMQALLFGAPRAGTPLLAHAPRAGLDLPLRALAWEADDGTVRVSFHAPEWIVARHGLPSALVANLAGIRSLVEEAASATAPGAAPSLH